LLLLVVVGVVWLPWKLHRTWLEDRVGQFSFLNLVMFSKAERAAGHDLITMPCGLHDLFGFLF
jgi:hypothetical protein